MEFAAVVVVYNQTCADSPTCQALKKVNTADVQVLIFDNSTKSMGNRDYCLQQNWTYLGGTGNHGISKAYNACIDYLKEQNYGDMVCLFDDDTDIDQSYFEMLKKAREDSEGRIFVPLIYSKENLLSPSLIKENHRGRTFKNAEEALQYHGNALSAINSCMALDISLFQDYHYDENIFLDGIDHTFLMDMKKRGEKLTIFPYRCNHEFSGDTIPPKGSALTRYRIYAKDYRYILRGKRWAYILLVGKRAAKLTLQYRTLSFAKVFIQNLLSKL